MKKISFCSISLLFLLCVKVYPFVVKSPHFVFQGDGFRIYLVERKRVSIRKITISWLGRRIHFKPINRFNSFVLGTGLNDRGRYTLKIEVVFKNRYIKCIRRIVKIRPKNFPKRYIKVPEHMITPPKKIIKKVLIQQIKLERILNKVSQKKFYDLMFLPPLKGKILSPFGAIRVFNHRKESIHKGIDIKAPLNSPVKSSSYGRVVFANNLYFGGKTVIIDHGLGVFTIYMHLNKIFVRRGEFVKKGKIIGLSGMTGRATGPHLHFGLSVLGKRINPLSIIRF